MSTSIQIAVILPAAGESSRFLQAGGKGPKLEQLIDGRPVLLRAVELFLGRQDVVQVILAVPEDKVGEYQDRYGAQLGFHDIQVIAGSHERWATVEQALTAVSPLATHVAVHDAARPLASSQLIDRVFEAAAYYPAVAPAVAVRDTLKKVGAADSIEKQLDQADFILGGQEDADCAVVEAYPVLETVDRSDLMGIQTPQVIEINLIKQAYAQLSESKLDSSRITDDAGLVEALGQRVYLVDGESTNLKITDPMDLELLDALVKLRHQVKPDDALKALFGDDDDE